MKPDYSIKLKRNRVVSLRDGWLWKLAMTDARFNFNRLILFISSVILGIAAVVAINSFNHNLQNDINNQAKELLGADITYESNKKFESVFVQALDSLKLKGVARDVRFASMVYFPENMGTRLIQVVAMDGDYPFYGDILLSDGSDFISFKSGIGALIDEPLSVQFDVHPGDSLKLGRSAFLISGVVTQFPGNSSISSSFAPSVYLPYSRLEETGLVQYGSRVEYNYYLFNEGRKVEEITRRFNRLSEKYDYDYETVESRKEDLGESFQNLYRFFNLLGFVALILGSIGVSSSVHIYLREKRESAAMLRCIGASGWQIFTVFFIQINILGFIGSILGVGFGLLIQKILPLVVREFLPVEVTASVSFWPLAEGLLIGLVISVLFAVLPLTHIRLVSPLEIFRLSVEPVKKHSRFRYLIIILVVLFPWLFAIVQTGSWLFGTAFMAGLFLTFLLLWLTGLLIVWLSRKLFPKKAGFIWKQGMANLFRPNNQTIVMVVVIGLGSFIFSTLNLIQNSLLGQVEFAGAGKRSNTILFDIQPYQKEDLINFADSMDIPVQQMVPIITTRLLSVKGRRVEEWKDDPTDEMRNWALNHEYRVTYRDSLIESEKLMEGVFEKEKINENDSIFISISDGLKNSLKLEIGDPITFDVQGVPVNTWVGSIREVDWQRIQTNFMVVFPKGVLEDAPQFYVLVSKIDSREKSARFQQAMVRQFPNVSVIDLTLILDTLDRLFDKVEMVIRFMALFSVITGLLVLSGAVFNSKYARLKENVLLRTLGAKGWQITGLTLVEYFYLGVFAALSGTLLSLIASGLLARYFFEISYKPDLATLGWIVMTVVILTILIGWMNTRGILRRSPLEILRKEV